MPCKPGCEPPFIGRITFGTGPVAESLLNFRTNDRVIIKQQEPTNPCICGKKMILRNRTVSYPSYLGSKFWWCGGCGMVTSYEDPLFPDEAIEEQRARKVWEEENKE